ncbi:hypothetical protein BABINDRAFT_166955 [Babjeviella inositovora NRRL Y-12698]|uniref:Uncharacterized protein n=1 Tax=Babjeviella inositovora NRRL Y-12698 TaxID=984486 RepID=A0A1E3QQ96_9ASCO|nr:uncharacterized protein BABINDRAFT_166955 [Babjeviella inositovora NRRL Y-12698]ODQ79855.1 hypothetical protein BABINDRAFT_166955 [Babjeviella inositovora NRRL Y-12698]
MTQISEYASARTLMEDNSAVLESYIQSICPHLTLSNATLVPYSILRYCLQDPTIPITNLLQTPLNQTAHLNGKPVIHRAYNVMGRIIFLLFIFSLFLFSFYRLVSRKKHDPINNDRVEEYTGDVDGVPLSMVSADGMDNIPITIKDLPYFSRYIHKTIPSEPPTYYEQQHYSNCAGCIYCNEDVLPKYKFPRRNGVAFTQQDISSVLGIPLPSLSLNIENVDDRTMFEQRTFEDEDKSVSSPSYTDNNYYPQWPDPSYITMHQQRHI